MYFGISKYTIFWVPSNLKWRGKEKSTVSGKEICHLSKRKSKERITRTFFYLWKSQSRSKIATTVSQKIDATFSGEIITTNTYCICIIQKTRLCALPWRTRVEYNRLPTKLLGLVMTATLRCSLAQGLSYILVTLRRKKRPCFY